MICSAARFPTTPTKSKQVGWWIERETPGSSLISMARVRRPANGPFPRPKISPRPDLWLDEVCAPGYRGRKRGQVVRTRTVKSFTHSFQWLRSEGLQGHRCYPEGTRQSAVGT